MAIDKTSEFQKAAGATNTSSSLLTNSLSLMFLAVDDPKATELARVVKAESSNSKFFTKYEAPAATKTPAYIKPTFT